MSRSILFAFYLLCATLVLLEVGVRLWGYSERYIHDPIYMPFDRTEEISYIHKPGLTHVRARGLATMNTDSLGLRNKTAGARYGPKMSNDYRIAVVGDSITFGEGVPRTEDTFIQKLEDVLNRKQSVRNVQAFNYGVSAYSVKQMASTLEHRMLEIEPDLVIMAIIPEDLNLTRTPTIDSTGYFVDRRFAEFIAPNSVIRRILRNVHFAYVIRNIVHTKQSDREGNPAIGDLSESYRYIQRFKEAADRYHLAYAIVLLPRHQSEFIRVPEQLERDHISFVDLSSLRGEFTLNEFRASRFDAHPSSIVHHRIGEALADYVLHVHLKAAERKTPAP